MKLIKERHIQSESLHWYRHWSLDKHENFVGISNALPLGLRLARKNQFFLQCSIYHHKHVSKKRDIKPEKLMVFSFLQRKCDLLTRRIKKIVDQPCYNVIFYLKRTEHKCYNKWLPCVYHLLRSIARSLLFSTSFFEHFFYN